VQKHIGIAVSVQAFVVWDFHAADDEFASGNKRVNVNTDSDSHRKVVERSFVKIKRKSRR